MLCCYFQLCSVADDVSGISVDDEVFASNWGQGRHDDLVADPLVGGAFGEYVLIPAHKLSRKPSGVTHAQVISTSANL